MILQLIPLSTFIRYKFPIPQQLMLKMSLNDEIHKGITLKSYKRKQDIKVKTRWFKFW